MVEKYELRPEIVFWKPPLIFDRYEVVPDISLHWPPPIDE
jgi:hypothetical protein